MTERSARTLANVTLGVAGAAAAYVVFGSITSNPRNALNGVLLLAAGIPVCLFWRRKSRQLP